jgi:hypothetical protein
MLDAYKGPHTVQLTEALEAKQQALKLENHLARLPRPPRRATGLK